MKKIKILATFCFLLLSIIVKTQTPPNSFNYSAVARNPTGQPIATTTIGIQITILKTSPTGESQYSENHFVNTDAYGLFNLVIGAGAVQSGSMTTIEWSNDNYYIKVGMDANGGTSFLTMGTTQLLSVPYALHSKSAEISTAVKIDTLTSGISIDFQQSLDLWMYPNITSLTLQNECYDGSIKIYKNGSFIGIFDFRNAKLPEEPISGDNVECKVFLHTSEGIKYYSQSYVIQ